MIAQDRPCADGPGSRLDRNDERAPCRRASDPPDAVRRRRPAWRRARRAREQRGSRPSPRLSEFRPRSAYVVSDPLEDEGSSRSPTEPRAESMSNGLPDLAVLLDHLAARMRRAGARADQAAPAEQHIDGVVRHRHVDACSSFPSWSSVTVRSSHLAPRNSGTSGRTIRWRGRSGGRQSANGGAAYRKRPHERGQRQPGEDALHSLVSTLQPIGVPRTLERGGPLCKCRRRPSLGRPTRSASPRSLDRSRRVVRSCGPSPQQTPRMSLMLVVGSPSRRHEVGDLAGAMVPCRRRGP